MGHCVVGIGLQVIRDWKKRQSVLEHIVGEVDEACCVIEHCGPVLQGGK